MDFRTAYEALKQGKDIKRPSWKGFWRKENSIITMHCKDGSIIPFMETEDIFFTLDHIMADDWELVDGSSIQALTISTFTFEEALSILKQGKKVTRKSWNGKNLFVVFQKGYPEGIPCNKQTAAAWGMKEGETFRCEPYLQINTTDNPHAMWVPSIRDCLAEDWFEVQ